MSGQRVLVLASAAVIAAAWVGCGGDDSETKGSSTTGAGGGTTTSVTTGVTSTGTTGPTSTGTGGSTALATECTTDSDCGADGVCIKSTDNEPVFNGGPANGYCSKACNDDADCGPGTCVKAQGETVGKCLLDCTIGPPLEGNIYQDLDPEKCHGRTDLRCTPLANNGGTVCLPVCGSDSQCDPGRFCHHKFGVCTDAASSGLEMGAACTQNDDQCDGVCINFTGGATACSNPCSLGGETIDTPECGGLASGICAYFPADNGLGDYAYCAAACTSHDDCQNPTFWCNFIQGITNDVVPNGFCFGVDKCPGGQDDCVNGGTCTDTIHGKYCLDPEFPLGSAGTGGGGGAGGAGTGGAGGAGTGGAGGAGGN